MRTPVALITGCSSGIGLALSQAFLQAGYRVWAGVRKEADQAPLQALGARPFLLDMQKPEDFPALAERVATFEGRLDVLINNAGIGVMGPLLDLPHERLQQQFLVNCVAPVQLARACLPLLRQSQGLVINIGSVSGYLTTPFAGAYCASKAAVHALSDALRLELAPLGVRVLEVQPGAIASDFGASSSQGAEQLISEQSPWWPFRDGIRARANASQDKPTPAAVLAQRVLRASQRSDTPAIVRAGYGSRSLPLLAQWLPRRVLDALLRRRFGL